MSSTCLQLVQMASSELGIATPTYVVGNPDQNTSQLLALLNAAGNELQRQFIWQHSTVPYMFTVSVLQTTGDVTQGSYTITNIPDTTGISNLFQVSGTGINVNVNVVSVTPTTVTLDQPCTASAVGTALNFGQTKFILPSDFDRPVSRTHWDATKHWELLGPATAQQWEFLQKGWIATGPRATYRLLGGYFQIWPIQTTPDLMGFEYISGNWVNQSGSFQPNQSQFLLDSDTCAYPDRLMVLALKKKYFEAKGFDTTALQQDYDAQRSIAYAADQGSMTLSMGQRPTSNLIGWSNTPDSGYGQRNGF